LVLLLLVAPAGAAAASLAHTGGGETPAVAVVGDSLTWQSESSIDSELTRSGYSAHVSADPGHALSSPWTQSEVRRDLRDRRFGVIVIETASNDSFQLARSSVSISKYSHTLARVVHAAAGRCVVVVNAKVDVTPFYYKPGDALAINQAISASAAKNPDERVVDWNSETKAHRSWFRTDLLHFTSQVPSAVLVSDSPPARQNAGDRAFARAIVEGIQSCQLNTAT